MPYSRQKLEWLKRQQQARLFELEIEASKLEVAGLIAQSRAAMAEADHLRDQMRTVYAA